MEGLFFKFDVKNQKWSKLKNMNFGRSGPGIFFKNDYIYVFGGFRHNNIERYNITENNDWQIINAKWPRDI